MASIRAVLGRLPSGCRAFSFSISRVRRCGPLTQASSATVGWARRQRRNPREWPWVPSTELEHGIVAENRHQGRHVPDVDTAEATASAGHRPSPGRRSCPRLLSSGMKDSRSWTMKPRVVLTVAFKLAHPGAGVQPGHHRRGGRHWPAPRKWMPVLGVTVDHRVPCTVECAQQHAVLGHHFDRTGVAVERPP